MWYSVQLLQDGSIFIEKSITTKKHGPKGKVLIPCCLYYVAVNIQQENS